MAPKATRQQAITTEGRQQTVSRKKTRSERSGDSAEPNIKNEHEGGMV